ISQGLRELGVESTLLVFNERPFERGFDVNLQLRDTGRKSSIPSNLPKQLRAFVWAVPRFDVFHFHAGLTLLPRKLNLPALRALRKGIVFQSWGSDLRGRPASDVVIDQLRIGWYGMLAIESMALAKPVVVHLDDQAAAETEEAFGLELPLMRATEQTLEDVLAGLVEVRESLPELGRRSRE